MGEILLELKDIVKSYDGVTILDQINLQIEKGEFVTFLGPSGCGKTTTLRIIAGLELPDEGAVYLNGEEITTDLPEKRNINTVFQNYSLFPHMTVEKNIGYGLKLKKVPKLEIKKEVKRVLELVQLEGTEKRMPNQLSGGQRQRVAIARAIVNKPQILLLDEPLGALDLSLRRAMQLELKQLQKKLGITFIYITHDQEEAINMSDKIAVMRNGKIIQVGTPNDIYNHPLTSYVASFVGSANIIKGKVDGLIPTEYNRDELQVVISNQAGLSSAIINVGEKLKANQSVALAIRSEMIEMVPLIKEANGTEKVDKQKKFEYQRYYLYGKIQDKSFAGGLLRVDVLLDDGSLITISRHGINIDLEVTQRVAITWDPLSAVFVKED